MTIADRWPRGIALGTAQFGMNYGITNRTGCPDRSELRAILMLALDRGIVALDTARGYGNAEERLGDILAEPGFEGLRIITKIGPLPGVLSDSAWDVDTTISDSVRESCLALRRPFLDVLMFHRFDDMVAQKSAALRSAYTMVEKGIVGALGVSVYTPEQAITSLNDERVQHIQVPFNLLDHRWLKDDFQRALKARPTVTIHARSIFLQGLLLHPGLVWPSWFSDRTSTVASLEQLRVRLSRVSLADLCMAYARAFDWIGALVIGVETVAQLDDLMSVASAPALTDSEVALVMQQLHPVPERLLNPAQW